MEDPCSQWLPARRENDVGTENVGTAFRLGLCAIVAVVLGLAIPFWAVGLVVLPLAVLGEWWAGELARRGELTTLFGLMQQEMARRATVRERRSVAGRPATFAGRSRTSSRCSTRRTRCPVKRGPYRKPAAVKMETQGSS